MYAVALGVLLCGSAYTPSAGADSVDASPAGAPLYGYVGETRGSALLLAQRIVNFNAIRGTTDDPAHVSFEREAAQLAVLTRLHYAFGSNLGLSSERPSQAGTEVSLRNSDAAVRAKVQLTLSKAWLGLAYADIGAADSSLKWQGVAGIRSGHGFDLVGGWRHVTYHFSPGMGFDSLDFNGPFVSATLAW